MIKPITFEQFKEQPYDTNTGVFVLDMPNEYYHAHPALGSSGLTLIDISLAHYAFAEPVKQTRAMEIGTAIHTAVLEPKRFEQDYICLEKVTDRRSSEYKQAIKSTGDASTVLIASESANVKGMRDSVHANDDWIDFSSNAYMSELSAFVRCPETGVILKARFDAINHGFVVDLKKTQDARYESFQKSIANYRYHVQDALYSYVYYLITGQELLSFRFLAIEEKAPHTCKMYELDSEAKAIGREIMFKNLDAYAKAERTGEWKTYDTTAELISLPAWALPEGYEEVEL